MLNLGLLRLSLCDWAVKSQLQDLAAAAAYLEAALKKGDQTGLLVALRNVAQARGYRSAGRAHGDQSRKPVPDVIGVRQSDRWVALPAVLRIAVSKPRQTMATALLKTGTTT